MQQKYFQQSPTGPTARDDTQAPARQKNWNIRDAAEFNRHLRSEGEPIMTTAESHPSRNYQRLRTTQGLWQGGEGSPS